MRVDFEVHMRHGPQEKGASGSSNKTSRPGECLVIVFRPRIALALVGRDPGPEFTTGSVRFRATTEGYLPAFYDRLYDGEQKFAGLEVTPIEDLERLLPLLAHLDYVRAVDQGRRVRVFIGGAANADVTSTADQAFGGRIYQDESGQVAFSIELDWLNESDLTTIKRAPVDWLTAAAPDDQ